MTGTVSGLYQKGPILGDEQLTGLGAVSSLTAVPGGATAAQIQVEQGTIRFRPQGLDPTPELGFLLDPGTVANFENTPLADLRFIEVEEGAIINVIYF